MEIHVYWALKETKNIIKRTKDITSGARHVQEKTNSVCIATFVTKYKKKTSVKLDKRLILY